MSKNYTTVYFSQTASCKKKSRLTTKKSHNISSNYFIFLEGGDELFIVSRNYIVLPVTDPNGNNVIFHSLKQTEPSKYSFADAARVYFMMIDWCIQHDGTSPGIVIVFDVTGLRFGHLTKLSLSLIHKILIYIQVIISAVFTVTSVTMTFRVSLKVYSVYCY